MTPDEQRDRLAEVIHSHQYVPSGLRGVSRCACGLQLHGMPHDHRAHLTDALLPVVAQIEAAAVEAVLAALEAPAHHSAGVAGPFTVEETAR